MTNEWNIKYRCRDEDEDDRINKTKNKNQTKCTSVSHIRYDSKFCMFSLSTGTFSIWIWSTFLSLLLCYKVCFGSICKNTSAIDSTFGCIVVILIQNALERTVNRQLSIVWYNLLTFKGVCLFACAYKYVDVLYRTKTTIDQWNWED